MKIFFIFICPLFLKSNKIKGGALAAFKHKQCGPWVKTARTAFLKINFLCLTYFFGMKS